MDRPRFDVTSAQGLAAREAASRLETEGPNELATARKKGWLKTVLEVLSEPMLLLLLAAGALYLALGSLSEALTLMVAIVVVIAIEVFQEQKTERALSALKDLTSPRAHVIRDGERLRIPGREVVRGDLVLLAEGDRVPADALLLEASNLALDESLLTGESVPVDKTLPETPSDAASAPLVFMGSLVVRGRGVVEVIATGARSELGKIGGSLREISPEKTALEREIGRIVRRIAVLGLGLCVLLVVTYGAMHGDYLEALLAGIALAMSLLPEEFPVVLTVFLALGATRLSRRRVLARRLSAIEALGTASVLCTDKTGTLTENRMRIAQLDTGEQTTRVDFASLPEEFHGIVEYGVLASAPDPFDPMEIAFRQLAEAAAAEHVHRDWELVREYPLSHALLSMSHVWRRRGSEDLVIAAKGAPEAIFDLCHLSPSAMLSMRERVRQLASQGLRVLGVARARWRADALPTIQHDFEFDFVGLAGLEDPLRANVADAVRECRGASIRVLMITGDYPETARTIGERAGLSGGSGPLLGQEVEHLEPDALRHRLASTDIVARASPAHKLNIIRALSLAGEVVAMTGDGVNDAPALKAAHIGIAMGGRGSDVAREAAALVVTDDDFSSIVAAIRLGRRIFDNLQKALAYVVAFHVPIAGLSLLPVMFGKPLALLPVHIVLLELIVDPVCSIVFEAEPEERDIMQRPPRSPKQGVFSARVLGMSILQGTSILLATLWVYFDGLTRHGAEGARSLAFTALIASNVMLVLVNRSWHQSLFASLFARNVALWLVLAFATGTLTLALFVPAVSKLFSFATTSIPELALACLLGASSMLWFEVVKWLVPTWSEGTRKASGRTQSHPTH